MDTLVNVPCARVCACVSAASVMRAFHRTRTAQASGVTATSDRVPLTIPWVAKRRGSMCADLEPPSAVAPLRRRHTWCFLQEGGRGHSGPWDERGGAGERRAGRGRDRDGEEEASWVGRKGRSGKPAEGEVGPATPASRHAHGLGEVPLQALIPLVRMGNPAQHRLPIVGLGEAGRGWGQRGEERGASGSASWRER